MDEFDEIVSTDSRKARRMSRWQRLMAALRFERAQETETLPREYFEELEDDDGV